MSKIKDFIAHHRNSPAFNYVAGAIALVGLYIIYSVYSWFHTQSTDNAYFESNITFVSPEVNGVVQEIFFVENAKVKKGDVLVKLRDDDYKASLDAAKSAFEAGKIGITVLDSQLELAKLEESKAKESITLAAANLEVATRESNRATRLAADNYSSKRLLDSATLEKTRAISENDQANLQLQSASKKISMLMEQKEAALQTLKGLESALQLAQIHYDNTEIKSPIDGVVTSNYARVGGYARAGMQFFAIVPSDNYYVKANYKEIQISKFKPGMRATVYFDSVGGHKFYGKIRNIYPATGSKFSLIPTDNATGNFTKIVQRVPVIIDVDIPKEYREKVAIGMSCSVQIRTNQ